MSIYKVPENTNIEETAQRTDILHFMDVTKLAKDAQEGDTVWSQMGVGWTSNTESPSAQTKERKFINEKSKRKNITSYAPSFGFEVLLMFNKPEVRTVYDIYTKRKTGTDAVVTVVTVDAFEEAVNGYYPARNGRYAVEVSSCDDDDDMIIKGNLNGQGDESIGWFDPKNGEWSDEDPAAQPVSQSSTHAADENE
ncbi:MAG: hypothetical protein K2H90_03495 [Oscillospiraceae bacterium]|nr:hypothetical protein [Oscillospiraceae bacterium]